MRARPQFHTTKATTADEPPDVQVPPSFGFALLATPITNGTVSFIWMFLNRTADPVEVVFTSTHFFDVTLVDGTGAECHLNDYMPPATAPNKPTIVSPGTEWYQVVFFDPTDQSVWPTLPFRFDPANGPYTIRVVLNSSNHFIAAAARMEFAP